MRLAPIGGAVGQLLNFNTSEPFTPTTAGYWDRFTPGARINAAPTDPVDTTANLANWGQCELVYAINRLSAAITPGQLVHLDKDYGLVDAPSTANSGRPIGVALTNFAAGNVTAQAGWVLVSGIAPVQFSVAATTGAVFLGTTGKATPTAAAGKQILGATTILAATAAFTRLGQLWNGSKKVMVGRQTGLYVGQAVSGTGIPGSTTIASLDPDGATIYLNNAATAAGASTLTFTNTNFGIVEFSRPHVQGQIT